MAAAWTTDLSEQNLAPCSVEDSRLKLTLGANSVMTLRVL